MNNYFTWLKVTASFQMLKSAAANPRLSLHILAVILMTGLCSCQPSKNEKMIPGTWTGVEWLVKGLPASYDVNNTAFQFNADGTYAYLYGEQQESGQYFITGQELYTTPEGGTKMMVKIKELTTDTLVFEMNRGGQLEVLTLVRQ